MYHYDPDQALTELTEEAILPHPVHVRDMIVRSRLSPEKALELNRAFQQYLEAFGQMQNLASQVLKELSKAERR